MWYKKYYFTKFNKFGKKELQEMCQKYNINIQQKKDVLIEQLINSYCIYEHFELNDETIDLMDNSNDYTPIRTKTALEMNSIINLNGQQIDTRCHSFYSKFQSCEPYLRELLHNHDTFNTSIEEITIKINSVLDVIKKPNTLPIEQPKNINISLFNYQKQNISWMENLELQIDNLDTISIDNIWPYLIKITPDILYSYYYHKFILYCPQKISLSYQGGILADSVGLGKSLTSIGLMLSKTRQPYNFYSRANLVLCPNHLAQQWFDEIEKNTQNIYTIMIRTKRDWENITYQELMEADIVIVTHQFLNNAIYNKNKNFYSYEQSKPNLELIQWHRIFLDEGHELVYNHKIFSNVLKLQSKYKWYVSGTPYITCTDVDYPDMCIFKIAQFLGIQISENEILAPYQYSIPNMTFIKEIITKLMIKNTKESVNLDLPKYQINNKLLEFHKTEKGRYDIAKQRTKLCRKWLLQLCCSMNLADQDIKEFGVEKTLEQIHEIMIVNQEKKLEKKRNTLINAKPKKQDKIITDERKKLITRLEREIVEIEKSLNYLKIVLSQITTQQSCPICLEIIDDLAITDCGHVFCSNCIEKCLQVNGKCPNCRTNTKYTIVSMNPNTNLLNINKYGTKITELIEFLKNTNESIIIFSQWDRLLHQIGNILTNEGFSNVFCQGSVFQRNKALQQFKQKKIQILMMSLHYAVSGTNLTEAKNMIILDLFDGSPQDIEKKEIQAIGRIHRLGQRDGVTVTRFIMKDTLEEELFHQLNETSSTYII